MEKIKIEIPKILKKNVIILFNKEIEIDTIITLEKYSQIVEDIRNVVLLNDEIVDKYMSLKIRYVKDVLDFCTNINTEEWTAEDINNFINMSDFNSLTSEIVNFYEIFEVLKKEYEKNMLENCFGVLGRKMPSSEDMEKSMKIIRDTIDKIPEDKLEMIGKSIVWNNLPALGNQISPVSHISEDKEQNSAK